MRQYLLLTLASLVFTLPVLGQPSAMGQSSADQQYSLPAFPMMGTCDETVAYASHYFTASTGLPVVQSDCSVSPMSSGHDVQPRQGYQLTLFYRSAEPLPLVTTDIERFNEDRGNYGTDAECQADIGRQVGMYRKMTGINPVFAYCYFERNIINSHPWTMRIDGFGKPAIPYFIYTYALGFDLDAASDQWVNTLVRQLTSQGYTIAHAFIRHSYTGESHLTIQYYAPSPLNIHAINFPFGDATKCQNQIPTVTDLFRKAGIEPMLTYCVSIGTVNLQVLSQWYWNLNIDTGDVIYANFAKCDADKARVLKDYQPEPRETVIGGLCTGSALYVRLQIFKTVDEEKSPS